jgi:hypothetical protein
MGKSWRAAVCGHSSWLPDAADLDNIAVLSQELLPLPQLYRATAFLCVLSPGTCALLWGAVLSFAPDQSGKFALMPVATLDGWPARAPLSASWVTCKLLLHGCVVPAMSSFL